MTVKLRSKEGKEDPIDQPAFFPRLPSHLRDVGHPFKSSICTQGSVIW